MKQEDCFSKENWLLLQALLPEQSDDALDIIRSAVMGLVNDFETFAKQSQDNREEYHDCLCTIIIIKSWFPIFFEDVDESGVQE